MEVFEIVALEEKYFPKVDELFKIGFGFEEDLPDKLAHSTTPSGIITSCVAVYRWNEHEVEELKEFDGQAVGFHIFYAPKMWQPSDIYYLEFLPHEYTYPLDELGFCEAVAVHPKFQRRGIGKKMHSWTETQVLKADPNTKGFITQVWTESGGALPLSQSNDPNHRVIKVRPNAWRNYYVECGLVCNYCNAPCCCTAAECETLFDKK